MAVVPGLAHHQHDLLRSWRVGRMLHPFVARRAAGEIPRHRRWRPSTPRRIHPNHRTWRHDRLPSLNLRPSQSRTHCCQSSSPETGLPVGSREALRLPRFCFSVASTQCGTDRAASGSQPYASSFVHAGASADASPAWRAAGRLCDQPSTPAADQPLVPRGSGDVLDQRRELARAQGALSRAERRFLSRGP